MLGFVLELTDYFEVSLALQLLGLGGEVVVGVLGGGLVEADLDHFGEGGGGHVGGLLLYVLVELFERFLLLLGEVGRNGGIYLICGSWLLLTLGLFSHSLSLPTTIPHHINFFRIVNQRL